MATATGLDDERARRERRYEVRAIARCIVAQAAHCAFPSDGGNRRPRSSFQRNPRFVQGLRHTFATRAIDRGMPIDVIAALLGHRSLDLTRRYAQISNRVVANEHAAVAAEVEAFYSTDVPLLGLPPVWLTSGL